VTALETALRRICLDLADAQAPFALVGGLAVSARTEPRFTRDADLAVAVQTDAETERLIRVLQSVGYRVQTLIEQQAAGRLATVRLTRSVEPADPVIDLLFASSGIEAEVVADAEVLELLPNLRIPVATTAHLVALKVLARDDVNRPQDAGDLRALLRVASNDDIARARTALASIEERGFQRGRDLQAEFAALLQS
jgi:predicted nucleotidyltransferase